MHGLQDAIDHWDVHHWQNFCPAVPQGLLQLTCGTPGIVYHGGLLNTRLFHFDPVRTVCFHIIRNLEIMHD